jgi:type III pantothenate kinase
MHGLSFGDLTGCIISSVVPQSIFNLRNLSRRYMNAEPLVIGENAKLGIEVRIAKPRRPAPTVWSTPSGPIWSIPATCS